MNHADHVKLLKSGVNIRGGTWADIGAGSGAFTLALADLIGPDGHIYAIDLDSRSLRKNEKAMRKQFPESTVSYVTADITKPFELPPLDGLVMANVLHFQAGQVSVLRLLRSYLKPGGRMLVVEYDASHSNVAVPYPVMRERWSQLSVDAGFENTTILATRPSRWLGEIYSTMSW